MAKLNIKIQKENRYKELETIVEIDHNNGHWKYWDDYMERTQDDKISLTMNNIGEAHYLAMPVKDAYPFCDHDLLKETGEYKITNAVVRPYNNLHEYLNCRIANAKEDFNSNIEHIMKYREKGRQYTAVLFDEQFQKHSDDSVVKDIVYEAETLIYVNINWVE